MKNVLDPATELWKLLDSLDAIKRITGQKIEEPHGTREITASDEVCCRAAKMLLLSEEFCRTVFMGKTLKMVRSTTKWACKEPDQLERRKMLRNWSVKRGVVVPDNIYFGAVSWGPKETQQEGVA